MKKVAIITLSDTEIRLPALLEKAHIMDFENQQQGNSIPPVAIVGSIQFQANKGRGKNISVHAIIKQNPISQLHFFCILC